MQLGNLKLTPFLMVAGLVGIVILAALMGSRLAKRTERLGEHVLVAMATLAILLIGLYWLLHWLASNAPSPANTVAGKVGSLASW